VCAREDGMPISVAGCLRSESLAKVKENRRISECSLFQARLASLLRTWLCEERKRECLARRTAGPETLVKALLALTDEEIKVALQRNEISEVGHAE
jgi:hypothetical protein